jgi:uncharacterized protein YfaP (DUF2135 family)
LIPATTSANSARAVLAWTNAARDLDFHLKNSLGHVYYGAKTLSGVATLDRDNTGGPAGGPETMAIQKSSTPYKTVLYVYHYSGETLLSNAAVSVTFYKDN